MATKSFMGKGVIYVEEIGSGNGLISIGNCDQLDLAIEEDKKEQKDFTSAGGATVDSVSRVAGVTASLNMLSLSVENVSLALRANIKAVVSGAIADEEHAAKAGRFIELDALPDFSVAPVVTSNDGGTTYTLNTDYTLGNSGLIITIGTTIPDGEVIKVSYTSAKSKSVESLTSAGSAYRLVFDGLNEADSGKAVRLTAHRVKFTPTQSLQMISDDFAALPLSLDLLKDESITANDTSPFFNIKMHD